MVDDNLAAMWSQISPPRGAARMQALITHNIFTLLPHTYVYIATLLLIIKNYYFGENIIIQDSGITSLNNVCLSSCIIMYTL